MAWWQVSCSARDEDTQQDLEGASSVVLKGLQGQLAGLEGFFEMGNTEDGAVQGKDEKCSVEVSSLSFLLVAGRVEGGGGGGERV